MFKINDFTLNTSFEQLIAQQLTPFVKEIIENKEMPKTIEVDIPVEKPQQSSQPLKFGEADPNLIKFTIEYNFKQNIYNSENDDLQYFHVVHQRFGLNRFIHITNTDENLQEVTNLN